MSAAIVAFVAGGASAVGYAAYQQFMVKPKFKAFLEDGGDQEHRIVTGRIRSPEPGTECPILMRKKDDKEWIYLETDDTALIKSLVVKEEERKTHIVMRQVGKVMVPTTQTYYDTTTMLNKLYWCDLIRVGEVPIVDIDTVTKDLVLDYEPHSIELDPAKSRKYLQKLDLWPGSGDITAYYFDSIRIPQNSMVGVVGKRSGKGVVPLRIGNINNIQTHVRKFVGYRPIAGPMVGLMGVACMSFPFIV